MKKKPRMAGTYVISILRKFQLRMDDLFNKIYLTVVLRMLCFRRFLSRFSYAHLPATLISAWKTPGRIPIGAENLVPGLNTPASVLLSISEPCVYQLMVFVFRIVLLSIRLCFLAVRECFFFRSCIS